MHDSRWSCPKCHSHDFDTDQFRATGGFLAKVFDLQNKRFTTVTCERCKFTEIYRADQSMLGNIFDLFTSGG